MGNGATTIKTIPTLVPGLHASAVAAGDNHSAAIRGDGVLVTWGANASGQIGDATTTARNVPTVIASPASVSTLALGDAHSVAVSPEGGLWTWGDGASGRLGDGGIVDRPTPQTVMTGLADWIPAAPAVSAPSGTYPSAQNVSVTSPTSGAVLRYSLDGVDPTPASTEVAVNGEVAIQYSSLFRVRAFVNGRMPSGIARADYQLESDAPSITPGTGTYSSAQTVTLSVNGLPAAIRYTLDGSEPTAAAPLYSEALVVNTALTLKARAFPLNGWSASPVSSSTFTFNYGVLDAPTATPSGNYYADAQLITLSAQPNTTIRYTVDGTDPTVASNLYTTGVPVSAGTVVVKARAFRADWTQSAVRSDAYTIDSVAPTITGHRFPAPLNSWHMTPVTVSFICADNVGVATCSAPSTIGAEGAGQTVTGTAVDFAGREAVLVQTLNLDLTPPTAILGSPADGLVTTDATIQLTGQVADALSGLAAVTCNGAAATVVDGEVSCSVALRPGRNAVVLTARDVAGNNVSKGVTVTRVGTPTRLTLSPATLTMLVDETATLSVLDDFGIAASSATWTSSNSAIVLLSADDPPVLTAVAAGEATISVIKNGLNSTTTITVVAGASLADGTTRWTVPPTPNLSQDSPIYTQPIDPSGPDAFTVETNVTTWDRTVRAINVSGEVQWMMAAPGVPLMGDAFGGFVGGIEPASNPCRAEFDEFEFCYTALTRFAGSADTMPWRYESGGLIDRPAIGPDGIIYAIEHLGGGKSVIILDGATGQVAARVLLANSVTNYEVANPQGACQSNYSEQEPVTVGPIVGADGFGHLLVRRRTR